MKKLIEFINEDSENNNIVLSQEQKDAAQKLLDFYMEISKDFTKKEMMEIDDWVGSEQQYNQILQNCKK